MARSRLRCTICGKLYPALICAGEDHEWRLCNKCFIKADALATREDRWPDERDYKAVQAMLKSR